ncbi:MAG: hypothetical protein GC162_00445 [Planctomycetes bacterium]|nr:hypothetical protein [Planctomycetota bacterium]
MDKSKLTRRNFGMLTAAAFGGMASGVLSRPVFAQDAKDHILLQEPHVCRGLNACKGKGACKTAKNDCKGHNECAGQGACATAEHHSCKGENACKGQGGCGEHPGENASCKGQGTCAVPLSKKAWPKARTNFEKAYEAAYGKKPAPAPAAA